MKKFRISYYDIFEGSFSSIVYAKSEESALDILFNDLGFTTIMDIEELSCY